MGLFTSESFDDLRELLMNQLRDLYDAENRILEALPKMAERANNRELKAGFSGHLKETQGHVQRLERIFSLLGEEPERETCEACKGLLKEGAEMLEAEGSPAVIDAGLILAAQRVEHYEMAGYGGARALALKLKEDQVADLLNDTLEEEKNSNAKLTAIAQGSVNDQAAQVQANP